MVISLEIGSRWLSNCTAAAAAAINLNKEDTHIYVDAVRNKEVAKIRDTL